MRQTLGILLTVGALTACRPDGGRWRLEGPPPASTAAATSTSTPTPASAADDPPAPVADPTIRVALTVDDLPGDPAAIASMIETFRAHDMPPVFGFVNGKQIAEHPERAPALRGWLAAGHRLGSHTFSHPQMDEIGVDAYIADIDANEPTLRDLLGATADEQQWKYFRYPFLEQGFDAESTARVRAHLLDHGYRVAEVTIDFGDWAWNPAYSRCAARADERSIAALQESFLRTAWAFLSWSDAAARQVVGRSIPHVLLLHSGGFDGLMMEPLLRLYEEQGVVWITLEEALDDDVYRAHEPPAKTYGDSMIEQIIHIEQAEHPPWILQPLALLDVVCR